MIKGYAPEELIQNKIDEILMAQMSNYVQEFIQEYEKQKSIEEWARFIFPNQYADNSLEAKINIGNEEFTTNK